MCDWIKESWEQKEIAEVSQLILIFDRKIEWKHNLVGVWQKLKDINRVQTDLEVWMKANCKISHKYGIYDTHALICS